MWVEGWWEGAVEVGWWWKWGAAPRLCPTSGSAISFPLPSHMGVPSSETAVVLVKLVACMILRVWILLLLFLFSCSTHKPTNQSWFFIFRNRIFRWNGWAFSIVLLNKYTSKSLSHMNCQVVLYFFSVRASSQRSNFPSFSLACTYFLKQRAEEIKIYWHRFYVL